ncbi:MAG: SDR family NAD(P)-dependent oxidoreductase [Alphaproteobacteria bacterium]
MPRAGWDNQGGTAVITGGANGIGRAAAKRLVERGMNVLLADRDEEMLTQTLAELRAMAGSGVRVEAQQCDVSSMADIEGLRDRAMGTFGGVNCLMNNAGTGFPTGNPWEQLDDWKRLLDINMWGVIQGCQAFIPTMLEAGAPAIVVNTGSKQGITKPPGNYAYNLSKTGVVAYTESVAHALRQIDDCTVSAHLLVPGFTYSGMIARHVPEKPPAAWTCQQTVDFMFESLARDDFYILCPDNDVTREMDQKRIQWNADDLIKNRPALSRWHPDFEAAFAAYMKD